MEGQRDPHVRVCKIFAAWTQLDGWYDWVDSVGKCWYEGTVLTIREARMEVKPKPYQYN